MTVHFYAPGATRLGPWKPLGPLVVRVAIERGFDCRMECEHLPPVPEAHGQAGDEWRLVCKSEDLAVELSLYSWIRNGVSSKPLNSNSHMLYGASLFFHHGDCRPREKCHLFAQGCMLEGTSAHAPDAIWGKAESALLEPVALAPVEAIDLERAYVVLEPVWAKFASLLEKKRLERYEGRADE